MPGGAQCGRAEEAIGRYTSVFSGRAAGDILRCGAGEQPDRQAVARARAAYGQVFSGGTRPFGRWISSRVVPRAASVSR